MSIPSFSLTRKIPLTLLRKVQGAWVNGKWVEGTETEVEIQVNIQPVKPHELLQFPEADRSREWYKVYSASDMRTDREGADGWEADEFMFEGQRYKVMKTSTYRMQILDHCKAWAARIELTPN